MILAENRINLKAGDIVHIPRGVPPLFVNAPANPLLSWRYTRRPSTAKIPIRAIPVSAVRPQSDSVKIPNILLPVFAAALLAAPFLEPGLFPLAWFAFVPLFWGVQRAENLRHAVFYGWFMGVAAHVIGFHWLVYTISAFGGFPYRGERGCIHRLRRVAGDPDGALCPARARRRLWPAGDFPGAVLGALGVFISALVSLVYRQLSGFFSVVDTERRLGRAVWRRFRHHVVERGDLSRCCSRPSENGTLPGCRLLTRCWLSSFRWSMASNGCKLSTTELAGARKLSVGVVQGNVDIDMKWNPVLAQKNLDQHRKLTDALAAVAAGDLARVGDGSDRS